MAIRLFHGENFVAQDIKSVVQAYRAQNPGLQYVVLVGDDHSIPFFYPNESGLGLRIDTYPPVGDPTVSNASLRDNGRAGSGRVWLNAVAAARRSVAADTRPGRGPPGQDRV